MSEDGTTRSQHVAAAESVFSEFGTEGEGVSLKITEFLERHPPAALTKVEVNTFLSQFPEPMRSSVLAELEAGGSFIIEDLP